MSQRISPATSSLKAVITGASMTRFGRHTELTVRQLALEAAFAALRDAEREPEEIGAIYFSNAVEGVLRGQEMLRGVMALRETPLAGCRVYTVEGACASSTLAFHLAVESVEAGASDAALVIGVEKLTHADKRRSLAAIGTAADLSEDAFAREQVAHTLLGGNGAPPQAAAEVNRSAFMDAYAKTAETYMRNYGATATDFATVAAKNHGHGGNNPLAQYGGDTSPAEVLASRSIVGPLTLLMCAPISDGAAALVVERDDTALRRSAPSRITVRAISSGTRSNLESAPLARTVSAQAYEQASLGPNDLSFVELHDAVAPAELALYDELGLSADGDPVALLRSGATTLGGRIPVNPSGGLVSRGHPIAATGAGQLVELVDQLRGRSGPRTVHGARVALAHNAGGHLDGDSALAAVTILSA